MIVKNILTGSIASVDKLRLSLFRPMGLRKVIKTIPYDNYILGVGYKEGDYQICISGRKKADETVSQALSREMVEELTLFPTKPEFVMNNQTNHFYKIHINNTMMNMCIPPNPNQDTSIRIIACIYGTETQIYNYLSHVHLDPKNEDRITHIWAEKASNLLSFVKI